MGLRSIHRDWCQILQTEHVQRGCWECVQLNGSQWLTLATRAARLRDLPAWRTTLFFRVCIASSGSILEKCQCLQLWRAGTSRAAVQAGRSASVYASLRRNLRLTKALETQFKRQSRADLGFLCILMPVIFFFWLFYVFPGLWIVIQTTRQNECRWFFFQQMLSEYFTRYLLWGFGINKADKNPTLRELAF